MPFLAGLLPLLGSIGTLAGTGIGIGEAVAGGGGTPNPTAPTTPAPTPPNALQLLQQKALVSQQNPNEVAATSGLANPDFMALMDQIRAGVLGEPGATAAGNVATGKTFTPANSQPTNSVVNGQAPNLSDFLSSFTG
jgi:hypothetical protein